MAFKLGGNVLDITIDGSDLTHRSSTQRFYDRYEEAIGSIIGEMSPRFHVTWLNRSFANSEHRSRVR